MCEICDMIEAMTGKRPEGSAAPRRTDGQVTFRFKNRDTFEFTGSLVHLALMLLEADANAGGAEVLLRQLARIKRRNPGITTDLLDAFQKIEYLFLLADGKGDVPSTEEAQQILAEAEKAGEAPPSDPAELKEWFEVKTKALRIAEGRPELTTLEAHLKRHPGEYGLELVQPTAPDAANLN